MKIVRISIILFLITSLSTAFADKRSKKRTLGVDPQLITKAMTGKKYLFNREYDKALILFGDLKKEYPDSVTGLFGVMAVWQIRMFENEDFRFKEEYKKAEKAYEHFSLRQLRKGDLPPWEYFIHGAADGMRGFFKGRQGKWFRTLTHGLHSMRMFKKLKWIAPNFTDADLGIGMYKFWRSTFTERVKILPFFSDQREEGIRMVKRVVKKGKYSKDLAAANLVFMYLFYNKYDKALKYTDKILKLYPTNLIMRFQKGKILLNKKKYDQALTIFNNIYQRDPTISKALLYKGITLYYKKRYNESYSIINIYLPSEKENDWRATAYYWLGRIEETRNNMNKAIKLYEKSTEIYEMESAQKRLDSLRNKLENKK